jgi:hypothetical protein
VLCCVVLNGMEYADFQLGGSLEAVYPPCTVSPEHRVTCISSIGSRLRNWEIHHISGNFLCMR